MSAKKRSFVTRFKKTGSIGSGRQGSAILCVLVVILLVTLLSVQTIQTLSAIRRGDDERTKINQARELIELGRKVDWSAVESQNIRLQIPDSAIDEAEPTSTVAVRTRVAIIERQGMGSSDEGEASELSKASEPSRIVVRYPADEPGEVTTTLDEKHE